MNGSVDDEAGEGGQDSDGADQEGQQEDNSERCQRGDCWMIARHKIHISSPCDKCEFAGDNGDSGIGDGDELQYRAVVEPL